MERKQKKEKEAESKWRVCTVDTLDDIITEMTKYRNLKFGT